MAQAHDELFLVDGSGYIFRAFFALPQLSTSRGLPTNAVYGFIRMLLKLIKERHPTHIGVIFDSPGKTFRDDLFEAYKANRAETPSDLNAQIPYIRRVVDAFRVRAVMREGYEADDVIATLAVRAAKKGFDTVVITADKDLMQIVGPHTRLWDTMRDKWTDVREVRERFGVEPHALVDIQALMGDPIDNVKGVPGVGEKTAAALVREFGGVDDLYRNLDRVAATTKIRGAKKVATLLAEHRGAVALARKLVRIDTEVPLDVEPRDFTWPGIDHEAVAELLRELEFTSLLRELTPAHAAIPTAAAEQEISLDAENLAGVVASLRQATRIALDLTTAEADAARLELYAGGRVFVAGAAMIAALAPVLNEAAAAMECHDLKRHLRGLARYGIKLAAVDFDTMLAGFLINPGRPEPELADLYHEHLAGLDGGGLPGSRPAVVAALREALGPRLKRDGLEKLFYEIELPVARVLAEMEATGIKVDAGALAEISREFGDKAGRLEAECYELAGREFNLNSPAQLRQVLLVDLKLATRGLKRTKSGYSTDAAALEKLAAVHPLPQKILEYRSLAKLKSTYSDALRELIDPATGRIHTTFHQALTATGRLSSSDPNLQNIPTRTEEGLRIRRAFVAQAGSVLLSADYSQIDLRVLAHLSGDPTLTSAFRNGEDIHVRTATEILGITPDRVDSSARRLAKTINFGIIYGMGPQRLAAALGISLAEASDYIKRYFERLEGVRAFIDEILAKARETGFVTTLYGRRRYLPELNAPEGGARAQAERIAVNTPIQGTAADLIKVAMVRLADELKGASLGARLLLQVHDELVLEVEQECLEAARTVTRREMQRAAQLKVPLTVDLKWGPNWAELST
jgi:DNA polymerase I